MKLEEVILRDTRANQPTAGFDAGEAPPGTIMYVTDESVTERVNDAGTAWEDISDAGGVAAGAVTSSGLTMATARLLGRTTASTGAIEEITVGSGLSLSAGSLTATGSASPIASGTANPGSPSNNDIFYRTDLDLLIFYDGTRWLTLTLYNQPFGQGTGTYPATTTATLGRSPTWNNDFDLWLEKLFAFTFVSTTNDGTKFWTVEAIRQPANTTFASFTTAAQGANTHTGHEVAIGALLGTTQVAMDLKVTITSTPGSIFCNGMVTYRLVVT